jgi:diguanylate cyclase (GGDEF)-like protein
MTSPRPSTGRWEGVREAATRWFSVGLMLVVGVIVVLQLAGLAAQREADETWQDRVRFAQNIERIRYYDELLTMSARLAAATGDHSYQVRYEAAVPELDAVLRDAVRFVDADARQAIEQTHGANAALVELERTSFELLADGDRAEAYAVLTSPRYAQLKSEYTAGLTAGLSRIDANARAESARVTGLQIGALVAGAVAAILLAIMWLRTARSIRSSHRARTRLEEQLRRQAQQDPLTGLANRRYFLERLAVTMARDGDQRVGVIFADLDRFKLVNDAHGHAAGDDLLVEVSGRIGEMLAGTPDALAARLGGDEFAILVPGCGTAAAERLADRLVACLARPYASAGQVPVTVSVGVAVADRAHVDAPDLLRSADLSMYDAKLNGANRWSRYVRDRVLEPGPRG